MLQIMTNTILVSILSQWCLVTHAQST